MKFASAFLIARGVLSKRQRARLEGHSAAIARELALIGARQREAAQKKLIKARARAMRQALGLPPSPALEG